MGRAGIAVGMALAVIWQAGTGQAETPPVIVNGGIPQPLTATPGNAAKGQALVRDMTRVSCLICHQLPLPDEPDQGNIGPPLNGIALRLSAPVLRLRLVDARKINPATVMPPYHALDGLTRVGAAFQDKTIYSAQEVEDVLAWLLTLRAP